MTDDLISRQAAIDALGEEPFAFGEYEQGLHDQWKSDIENINQIPSAQPERTGRWIYKKELEQFFCNKCDEPSLTYDDFYIYSMDFPNFCPNCGSPMEVEHEG